MDHPAAEIVLVSSARRWGIDSSDLPKFEQAVTENIQGNWEGATVRFLTDNSGQWDSFLDEGKPCGTLKRQVEEILAHIVYRFAPED